jgi:hypothetical protein
MGVTGRGYPALVTHEITAGIFFYHRSGQIVAIWDAGQFYQLREAYDIGLLTREDLFDIANNYNGFHDYLDDYLDGNHEGLSASAENFINRQYWIYLNVINGTWDLEADVWIEEYYGSYNHNVAVIMNTDDRDYADAERLVVIAGVEFRYNSENSIIIFSTLAGGIQGFVELQDAYDFGLLTREDLVDIATRHNEIYGFL